METRINIICVAPHLFWESWRCWHALLREALRVAGDQGDAYERIKTGELQCWLVVEGKTPLAACFTDISVEDNGGRFVGVYGLTGRQSWRWAGALSDRMTEFARAERCDRVLFKGRRAWGRMLREFKPIGREGAEYIWERTAA